MFQRVLLSTDGSAESLAAIEPAVRASTPDGEVLVVTVVPTIEDFLVRISPSTRNTPAALELAEHALERRRVEARTDLETAARGVQAAGGRIAGRVIESGEPGPRIIALAEAEGCDVIVMATNGRSGWRRAILGSVADFVVRNSESTPVLLVRRGEA